MPIEKADKIWMNGELVDWDSANVHVLTHTCIMGMEFLKVSVHTKPIAVQQFLG